MLIFIVGSDGSRAAGNLVLLIARTPGIAIEEYQITEPWRQR
jgi:hypothetical protein